jgi:hypothetical protein
MRPVSPIVGPDLAGKVLELCQASQEVTEEVFDAVTVTNLTTKQYTLNVSTATLADVVKVLATLITDLQHRGKTRVG